MESLPHQKISFLPKHVKVLQYRFIWLVLQHAVVLQSWLQDHPATYEDSFSTFVYALQQCFASAALFFFHRSRQLRRACVFRHIAHNNKINYEQLSISLM